LGGETFLSQNSQVFLPQLFQESNKIWQDSFFLLNVRGEPTFAPRSMHSQWFSIQFESSTEAGLSPKAVRIADSHDGRRKIRCSNGRNLGIRAETEEGKNVQNSPKNRELPQLAASCQVGDEGLEPPTSAV
jgi:hypothetical protein